MLSQQEALFILTPGAPFKIVTKDIPPIGPGDLLVKLGGIGLNPVEWKVQSNTFNFPAQYPRLIGMDGAGTVHEVGKDVTGFKKGDRV